MFNRSDRIWFLDQLTSANICLIWRRYENIYSFIFVAVLSQITELLKKDFISEFRFKVSLNSIFLYVLSTVFILYLSLDMIEEVKVWVALYWIIMVFAAINATFNSFRLESGRQFYYYYGLVKAEAIIMAKLIFNGLLMLLISLLTYFLISLLNGNPIENQQLFILSLILGSLDLSACLSLVSAIASKTGQNSSLVAILAFPILLPIILIAIKVGLLCGLGFGLDESGGYLLALGMIYPLIVSLALILFPYLWRS